MTIQDRDGPPSHAAPAEELAVGPPGVFARALDSDLWHSFKRSPVTVIAAVVTVLFLVGALFAPLLAPYDPFDPATLILMDGFTPPMTEGFSGNVFWLGTDDQGRDIFSAILYGARISLMVGFAAVTFGMVLGVSLGLLAGYVGGWVDGLIMRVADIFLSFPTILIALLVDGVARAVVPSAFHDTLAIYVLIFAIGVSTWVQYARTVRGSTLVEKNKEYVQAARVIGIHPGLIMLRHVLPNVMGPVLVIATIGLALAIITEATLSFLGIGAPPTRPSLGTLIRIGNDFLFSGEWWITFFPGIALLVLALSVNLLGDWLRDALNPKLR
ncbi:MAG: ABC transporter permease [Alphaproteobacteria bacterium]